MFSYPGSQAELAVHSFWGGIVELPPGLHIADKTTASGAAGGVVGRVPRPVHEEPVEIESYRRVALLADGLPRGFDPGEYVVARRASCPDGAADQGEPQRGRIG